MRLLGLRSLFLCLALAAAAGCVKLGADVVYPCEADGKCPDGLTCVEGLCRAGCADDEACGKDERCLAGKCLPILCTGWTCPVGEACVAGHCTSADCAKVVCPEGKVCAGKGQCYTPECEVQDCSPAQVCDVTCVTDLCAGVVCDDEEQVCAGGSCQDRDCAGKSCGQGAVCSKGRCEAVTCVDVSCTSGICANGRCLARDCSGQTCGEEQVCRNETCVDAACEGVLCTQGRCERGACIVCAAVEAACADGVDDDCNGLTDCADPACDAQGCDVPCSTGGTCQAGTCQGRTAAAEGTPCRAAKDACDQAETCDGTGLACPADAPAASGTACVADANACTSDECDGKGACVATPVSDGTACGSGLKCKSGLCGDGCDIGEPTSTHYATGAANPDNACQVCDPARSVSQWSAVQAGVECPILGLGCQEAFCDGAGACKPSDLADGTACAAGKVCVAGTCVAGCWMDSKHYAGGDKDGSGCGACDPAKSTASWTSVAQGTACPDEAPANACTDDACDGAGACKHTNKANGTDCGSGLTCKDGSCGSGCDIGSPSEHYDTNAPNPGNSCQLCDPAKSTTAWSNAGATVTCPDETPANECTADACDGAGACKHAAKADGTPCGPNGVCISGACQVGCWISNAFVPDGTKDAGGCRACVASKSATAYSNLDNTVACADEGEACTTDLCNGSGACGHTAKADGADCAAESVCTAGVCKLGCYISGAFYDKGTKQPGQNCAACVPATSRTAWTALPETAQCYSTDHFCHAGTCSYGCVIDGTFRSDQELESEGCRMCMANSNNTGWQDLSNGTPCGSSGVCEGGHCYSGCWIGGGRRSPGDLEPGNSCHWCDPDASRSAWSDHDEGNACAGDGNECTDDVCRSGVCEHEGVTDLRSCDGDTRFCNGSSCDDGCVIGGTFYPATTVASGDPCKECYPGMSRFDWSPRNNDTNCGGTWDLCCNGACINVEQDDLNCGSCGHNCGGLPCSGGNCIY